ncbi:uncharacterized protein LOC110175649 [Boleophthalmus pectinirostris]|uniref:uncharacterized protein LOC110175649 n=1 Tax=Boleophthalmus pectinirostris TaxID=150288 RepID=UPI00242ED67E|nr:uncharacterized protein LOC110175649 [Boleophthalmus pectinirostris]
MKGQILFFLALTLTFCSSGSAIKCSICSDLTDPTCKKASVKDCAATDTMCFVSTTEITQGGTTTTRIIKKCADSSLCPAADTQTYSLNTGSGQVFAQATCCNKTNCNKDAPPLPSPPGNSSVQCPTCDPQTGTCTTNVTCNELETSCFQTTATTTSASSLPTRGCASPKMCTTSVLNTFLPELSPYTAVTGPSSCSSNTTTVPPTTTTTAPVQNLSCSICTDPADPTCKQATVQRCPVTSTMCFVSTTQITQNGTTTTRVIKKCADSSLCPVADTQTYSLNTGSGQVFAQATCCNKTNCNKDSPQLPSPPGNSSVQCPTCDPQTGTCTTNVTCNELETSCFQTTATTSSASNLPTQGCASPNTGSNLCSEHIST